MPTRIFLPRNLLCAVACICMMISCGSNTESIGKISIITLDPGHFHAALVQKTMYPEVDSVVHVYAPPGNDLQWHLDRILAYNNNPDHPTTWKERVYAGPDFFEKMLEDKPGSVVVLAGNNLRKSEYIVKSLQAGLNVYADKPMAIDSAGFETLKQSFDVAAKNKLLLYDIMTERFEITSVLQRELAKSADVFGTLEKGTAEHPSVIKESVHCLYKNVSGKIVTRPAWFLDAAQQGDGLTDVMTHLVDLVQWECFPDQSIDYKTDILVNTARRWPTNIGRTQYTAITNRDSFPDYLKKNVQHDTTLNIYCNGEINYTLRGVHAKTTASWAYQAPGGNDTYHAIMQGSKSVLEIRQTEVEKFQPALYIRPVKNDTAYATALQQAIAGLQKDYPGLAVQRNKEGWQLVIPDKFREGHESHFARVTQHFLEYLQHHDLPAWEVPGMLAKYYTTIQAWEKAGNL